jgi:hypothetical protein
MTDALDVAFARSFIDAWNAAWMAMDTGALLAMCSEGVSVDDTGEAGVIAGAEAVSEYVENLLRAASIQSTSEEGMYLSLDRTRLMVRHRTIVTPAGTDARVTVSGVALFEFEDGLVSRWTAFVRDPDWMGR